MKSTTRAISVLLAGIFLAVVSPRPTAQEIEGWAKELGERVRATEDRFPILDRAVLVPDVATYVDEISKWSTGGRWPVLIDDDRYTPMFLRAFEPAVIVQRGAVGEWPKEPDARKDAIVRAVVDVWRDDDGAINLGADGNPIRAAFQAAGHEPPGMVFMYPDDPAWTAGLALAAGRGQLVAWFDESYGPTNRILEGEGANRLLNEVIAAVNDCGYPAAKLGDVIEAVTICADVAARIDAARPGEQGRDLRAVTDFLGRVPGGDRFAFGGWIFGDEVRSAYVAMSSLFLDHEDAWAFNTYPTDQPGWSTFGMNDAAQTLENAGLEVRHDHDGRASEDAWLGRISGGIDADLILTNTKGNAMFFDMAGGGRSYAGDVPVLNTPAAVHFIHSWSLMVAGAETTVGGRWIDRGAVAYVGSVQEPRLGAFVAPEFLAKRVAAGVPFLVAARLWDKPPWRIATYGDPLMVIRSSRPDRLPPEDAEVASPRDQLKAALAATEDANDPAPFRRAFRLCDRLGEDDVAAQLWRIAVERGHGEAVAAAARPSLFRARDTAAFVESWNLAPGTDNPLAQDMLWHLLLPRARAGDDDALLLLSNNVRDEHVAWGDLERLVPLLQSRHGRDLAAATVMRALEQVNAPAVQRRLRDMLDRIERGR